MTEEIRPICLYVETCLDKKEGTRDCAKCEHHLNYWTEVMIRDMEKNIKRLEQENKELKDNNNHLQVIIDDGRAENKRFREENKELKEMLSKEPKAMQAFQIAYSSNKKENEVLWGMVKDYKTALEEIKHILEIHKDELEECLHNDIDGMIQNKINEVLTP